VIIHVIVHHVVLSLRLLSPLGKQNPLQLYRISLPVFLSLQHRYLKHLHHSQLYQKMMMIFLLSHYHTQSLMMRIILLPLLLLLSPPKQIQEILCLVTKQLEQNGSISPAFLKHLDPNNMPSKFSSSSTPPNRPTLLSSDKMSSTAPSSM
jgi:hypothetical protein